MIYEKGEYILRSGDSISSIGLVLEGSTLVISEDFWGDRDILSEISVGEIFGESYAASDEMHLLVNVVAAQDVVVMFLDVRHMIAAHTKLIQNLVSVLADKNILLTNKIQHMTQKKIKDKILSYLSQVAKEKRSSTFDIPFNREELADYLSVDRSALSNELSKLRDAGILIFKKNHFELLG